MGTLGYFCCKLVWGPGRGWGPLPGVRNPLRGLIFGRAGARRRPPESSKIAILMPVSCVRETVFQMLPAHPARATGLAQAVL